jgi:hypothetical protein
MSNPTIRIHDLQTNEVIDREMTEAEFSAWSAQKAIDDAKALEVENKETAKTALLAKLGITAEEAALLLG